MALGRADKAKLKTALESMPAAIDWLRDPILDIAKQDQDLLSCGEADPTKLMRSLRQHAEDAPDVFVDAADALREWMNAQGDVNAAWAGPIWFVEGFVRGCDMFGADAEALAEPPPAPPLGLRTIELDLPTTMKHKFYTGGVELTDRNVQMFVIELDAGTYEVRRRGFEWPRPPGWPTAPHLREECDPAIRLGEARGVKITARHTASGLVGMAMYQLKLGSDHIEASIFAKKKTGCAIEPYEAILATLRRKA